MLDKEAVKSISVPKLLASMRSEGIPFLTDYYRSSRKRFNLINIWVDLTKGQTWTISTDGDHPQEIGYGYQITFPDVRLSKQNHIRFKQDMESIKSDEKLESDWGEYLPSQVLKSEEVLLVTMLYREDGGRRWIVDPDKSWNMKTDKACKVRLNTLRKSYSDPLLGQQTSEDEIIDDIIPEDEIIDDDGDPADDITRLLDIEPVEEDGIIDDLTPDPVDDPTEADAGLTSEQEETISAEMIQGLVQGHILTEAMVEEAHHAFMTRLKGAKKDRWGRYKGKDVNVRGMQKGLERVLQDSFSGDNKIEAFNSVMTEAMNSHKGSEVEVEVARSQFNPLKVRLDLKPAFFNEKGRKRRDRSAKMMDISNELEESIKKMHRAGLIRISEVSSLNSLFGSLSEEIKNPKAKFNDILVKFDAVLRAIEDSRTDNALFVEGLTSTAVQTMKDLAYTQKDNSRTPEQVIGNKLKGMLDELERKVGPNPIIERVRQDALARILSNRYTWENHTLFLPEELYELARIPNTNSAASSLEGVCVSSTVKDFNFESSNLTVRHHNYLIVTSPNYPGLQVKVRTDSREVRKNTWESNWITSAFKSVDKGVFKEHMKAMFFGLSIVNNYDDNYDSIRVHYESGGRAFYQAFGNYTVLSPTDSPTTALHEVMHSLEHVRPEIGRLVRLFLLSRVDTNNFTKVKRGEWGFKDSMYDDYASKVYEENSTEVVTMGVQEFITTERALQLAKNDYPHYLFSHMIVTGKMKDYL